MDPQRSAEWFDDRLGKLTSTGAAAIMGTAAARRRYLVEKAVEIATGDHKEIRSKYLEFGKHHENAAIAAYEFETGLAVRLTGLVQHPYIPVIADSPDGLVTETWTQEVVDRGDGEVFNIPQSRPGVVEAKSRYDQAKHVATIFDDAIPKEYVPQCHWHIWCNNAEFCDYVSYCPAMPPASQLHIIRLWRDEKYLAKLEQKTGEFVLELDDLVEKLL